VIKKNLLSKNIIEHINILKKIKNKEKIINRIIEKISACLLNKKKILICGNGGSAADAQHLAAEFLVRLRPNINRKPYPIISLALDTSTITACGNDYSFDKLFLRNFQALYNEGDILLVMSTSGNSKNIINVLRYAYKKEAFTVGLLGNKGGESKNYCKEKLIVDSSNTARIQETHIFIGHYILESVENILMKKKCK
jgi:D-sedoheptulose 7-phosphate isomerase